MRCTRLLLLLGGVGASPLQAQTDPSGSWRTWHTEHFRVHAKSTSRAAALSMAREAERAYALLAQELPSPDTPIELVLQDNLDVSNGLATFFPSNRINIYAPAPSESPDLGFYDAWFRVVVVHELAHIFHLDAATGGWRVLQKVFGRAPFLFPNAYQPSWVSEGLATYYESRFTTAGRVRGAYHDQVMAATAAGGNWVDAGEATFIGPTWPSGLRPYAWGSRFFERQAATWGDSVVPRFVTESSGQLWPINTSGPLRRAGGSGVSDAWREMRNEFARVGRPGPRGEVVVDGLRSEPSPRVSPDGRQLAYLHNDGKRSLRLVVLDVASGRRVASRRLTGGVDFTWIGDTIYLVQLDYESAVDIRKDLYGWRPGTGDFTRLTHGARIAAPFALPGGGIGTVDIATGTSQLMVVAGEDGRWTASPLAAPPAAAWGAVHGDGRGALVAARNFDGQWDIVAWSAESPTEFRAVTSDSPFDSDPAFGANGRDLLFMSERSGMPQIYRATDLGAVERITDEPAGAREPAVSGDSVLFYSTFGADGLALVRAKIAPPSAVASSSTLPDGDGSMPFEAAPQVPVEETGYRPWPALRPRHWLPYGRDAGVIGTFVGVATSSVDPIGRTRFGVAAAMSPSNGRAEWAVAVRHQRWKSVALDLGARQTWDDFGLTTAADGETIVPISERERVLDAGVALAARRWWSGLSVRAGGELEQEVFINDGSAPLDGSLARPWFAGAVVAASARYRERPAMAISFENGIGVGGLYRRRWRLDGPGWSDEIRVEGEGYLALPLPGFAHWVLAAHAAAGFANGPLPTTFAIGGESGDPLVFGPGFVAGAGRRSFAMRGYRRGGRTTRAMVSVAELRVPLLAVGQSLGKIPLALDRLSLTAFAETGGGWNAAERAQLTELWDVGAELVADVAVFYDTALRVRGGVGVPLTPNEDVGTEVGDPRIYVTFGTSF